jgi:adenine deaminase
MKTLIQSLPKAELHLHIEGTLEPELMLQLATKNKINLPFQSVDEIHQAYQFSNLQSFLDIYYFGASVLITEQDFYDLTWAYFQKAKENNITHAEIFFDPQTHTDRGIAFETVIKGIHQAMQDAKEKLGITNALILCFLRHLSQEQAFATLEQAMPHLDKIKAVGLDSSELNNPPEKFKDVFAKAAAEGLLTVAHAGEEGGADYIWQALNLLQVRRIDHGVQAIHDDKLVAHLAETQIPLTICPLSNKALHVFPDLAQLPLKALMDAGVCVTINSDDPAYFGGYLNDNYIAVQEALNLTEAEIRRIANNSFEASFL